MEPLIKHGTTLSWKNRKEKDSLRLGQVYIIKTSKGLMIKKLFAKSGDRIQVKWEQEFCQLKINGELIKNSQQKIYHFSKNSCRLFELYQKDGAGKIPQGMALVLGDYILNSKDSSSFGLISENDIIGEVLSKNFSLVLQNIFQLLGVLKRNTFPQTGVS